MTRRLLSIAVAFSLATAWLSAAPQGASADLRLTLSAPSGQKVYQSGTFTYTVANIGKKTAADARLVITLPSTGTSPQVYVLGTVNSHSTRCTRSGVTLTCPLGTLAKGALTTVYVNVMLPYSWAPIRISGVASTTSPEPTHNNTVVHTASLGTWSSTMSFGTPVTHQHCTGTPALTSFFECTLFPSSISEHQATFEANGSITIAPGYSGTWTYSPATHRLQFDYFSGGDLVAQFDGRGVGGNCFEGLTTFVPASEWVSPYRLCFP